MTGKTIECWGFENPCGEGTNVECLPAEGEGDTPTTRDLWGLLAAPSGTYDTIVAGWHHTCAIRSNDQTVECWGWEGLRKPATPSGMFTSIAAGSDHSCGIRADKTAVCWGLSNQYGQLDAPDGEFLTLASRSFHTCGLRTDATITCWGRHHSGHVDAP